MISIQADPFDAGEMLGWFARQHAGAGAITSFIGQVRASGSGGVVEWLELQHHERLTLRAAAAVGKAATDRFRLDGHLIIHRVGRLAAGESIVLAAAAAPHRRAAFEGLDYIVDRLKTELPIWKAEHGPQGVRWIEAAASDRGDRQRWGAEEPLW